MDYETPTELTRLIRKLSYREGDFTLSSGHVSNFYVDLKATTLHPEGAHQIGEVAVHLISRKGLEVKGVGGLTLGADPLATAISLAARSKGLYWPAFIVRKEPKGHGTSRFIEGVENIPVGSKLLVLEDVVTTGGSSKKAISRLRQEGYHPIAVLAVVDREEGGADAIESEGVSFFSMTTLKAIREVGQGLKS